MPKENDKKEKETVNLMQVTKKQQSEAKTEALVSKIHESIAIHTKKTEGMTVSEIQKALIKVQYYYNNTALEYQFAEQEEKQKG